MLICQKPRWILKCFEALAIGALMVSAVGHSKAAFADDADLFRGKRITVYIGYGPAGGFDQSGRFLARHMGNFIPGNPTLIPMNRPGAGSITLANELYNTAPRDGTAIGTVGEILPMKQVLGEPGIAFEAAKFNWIGRLRMNDAILVVRNDSGITTIEDARSKPVIFGVPGAGSATALELTVLNQLLGMQFKMVSGYSSGNEIRLAVERGEVAGTGGLSWRVNGDWVRQNPVRVILQKSPVSDPSLPNVPLLIDLARNDDERQLLQLFIAHATIGRAFLAPPQIPADRVRVLRTALKMMSEDPAVIAEANKIPGMELDLMTGEDLQKFVEQISNLPPRLHARALEVSAAK